MIVSDDQVRRAFDWLVQSAGAYGEAKARAVETARMREHVLAVQMKEHPEMSAAAQEREARASKAYRDAITEEAKAAGAYEQMKALREAAHAKIEAWRSEQANIRAARV